MKTEGWTFILQIIKYASNPQDLNNERLMEWNQEEMCFFFKNK